MLSRRSWPPPGPPRPGSESGFVSPAWRSTFLYESSLASMQADCKPGYTRAVVDPIEYDSYFVPSLFEPWSREVIKRAQVWKGDRVLDVACGTGIVACRIAGSGAKVTGIELRPERLAQARVRATEENVPVT